MKIVIDMTEDYYELLMDKEQYDHIRDTNLEYFVLVQKIKNGTILPKGHGRLIEVSEELECELWTYTRYTGIDEAPYEDATKALELAPTIIEAENEE